MYKVDINNVQKQKSVTPIFLFLSVVYQIYVVIVYT